ncbi:MAG: hypothetical protein EXS08_17020 [Planctomycetes bacterium]|nr:hypothetical protein [Planctomycetota bacterium]
MSERIFVRAVHWVVQVDELGLGDPGINNPELRGQRSARVNGAGIEYWASAILANSSGPRGILFEGLMADGSRVEISAALVPEHFRVRFERAGKQSSFVALAHVARHRTQPASATG